MKSRKFSNALGEINDKYITEAAEYQAKKQLFNWKPLVACAAVIALFFGTIPFFNIWKNTKSDNNGQMTVYIPLTFTAYAIDNEHKVTSVVLHEGETVPVSLFNTENGLKGFVFSYDLTEPGEQTTSVSIMTESTVTEEKQEARAEKFEYASSSIVKDESLSLQDSDVIEEIANLEMEKDKHYTYYVPDQSKSSPHRLMIPTDDVENNTVSEYHLLIEETENGYVATIEKIVTHERKVIEP